MVLRHLSLELPVDNYWRQILRKRRSLVTPMAVNVLRVDIVIGNCKSILLLNKGNELCFKLVLVLIVNII